ncbi:hypothetical protein [Thermithiobacillus plumbiphilus]|uniref:Uncharacterized protein n=1 Tax=Thermithiobacillus plumbiphilus TaxID=1729899 RepID=A0ABU9D806_9PROT
MKFSELPFGQQFEWQGENYSKVSPLMARQLVLEQTQQAIAQALECFLAAVGEPDNRKSDPAP